ncbi:MAG: type I methionyl aminopeptidase [Candidatus Moeniiplasma glomeromycotorum]|nr:type I methionyl aminopeptidase [Candidatus Moeniiplasma glomeromycotorum]MCE8168341.1 type I methionyl aminopeptidase [Candidatus Moeniiplasma glomeromycotorum]MCE8169912.1 type I methionyl aminopeptidase [Candidatus Moeniiplasma glomeromycotorum]
MDKKLACIRKAGVAVAHILKRLKSEIKPGVCGKDLEKLASQLMKEQGVQSSSLNYELNQQIFPSSICVSVNQELTHGIPTAKPFQSGDLVSIDVACHYQGYHADAALTTIAGEGDEQKKNLLMVTKKSLEHVIRNIQPNITTARDIGIMLEKYIRTRHYYPIKEYGGHGIGEALHQPPFIPNSRHYSGTPEVIRPGMFICVEPLVQIGDDETTKLIVPPSNWEVVVSKNGHLNAHFEHTLYITKQGVEIITNYEE